MIQKFRKKPVVIEAIQYTGHNGEELRKWSNGVILQSPVLEPTKDDPIGAYVQIKTLEGIMIGTTNDWIIKGVQGEFYPCKPDIFEKTYESMGEPMAQNTTKEPVIENLRDKEKFFHSNVLNPYPSESQSHTAYEKGFREAWDLISKHLKSNSEPVIDWEGLEKAYLNNCCFQNIVMKDLGMPPKFIKNPHNVFEWFKPYLKSNSEPVIDWQEVIDNFECLIGYLESYLRTSDPPGELEDVINDANNWLKENLSKHIK